MLALVITVNGNDVLAYSCHGAQRQRPKKMVFLQESSLFSGTFSPVLTFQILVLTSEQSSLQTVGVGGETPPGNWARCVSCLAGFCRE